MSKANAASFRIGIPIAYARRVAKSGRLRKDGHARRSAAHRQQHRQAAYALPEDAVNNLSNERHARIKPPPGYSPPRGLFLLPRTIRLCEPLLAPPIRPQNLQTIGLALSRLWLTPFKRRLWLR